MGQKFYWPSLKKVIEGLWEKGKRTLFYAEGNWTPYLEKIAELPDKSIVFHVDTTDMKKAKEILGGRFCISGNVPNTMLAYGTPEEVRDYCKKLIVERLPVTAASADACRVVQWDAKEENIRVALLKQLVNTSLLKGGRSMVKTNCSCSDKKLGLPLSLFPGRKVKDIGHCRE